MTCSRSEFCTVFQCAWLQRLITNFCANIFNRNFASNRELLRGANSPIKCFDSLQEFVICFEKKSSLLRFLNRIEVASFHFRSQQQRIECVCMRIYFSMLYAEIFSFSSPSSETKDGIWWWSIAKREKITSRSKAIASFPALFQVVLESKNKSDALKNIISHILMERKYFFQSHVVVVAFQMF